MSVTVAFISSFMPTAYYAPLVIVLIGVMCGLTLVLTFAKEDVVFLATLFSIAFLIRTLTALLLYNFSLASGGRGLLGDGWCYAENGRMILNLWLGGMPFEKISVVMASRNASGNLGFYDFWNAIVYFFTGISPLSVVFINCLAGSLTILVIYQITKKLCNNRAARYAAALTAFWPSLFCWSLQNLKEPITIFLTSVLIWAVLHFKTKFRLHLIFTILLTAFALKVFRGFIFYMFFLIILPISVMLPLLKPRRLPIAIFMIILLSLVLILYASEIKLFIMKMLKIEASSILRWAYEYRSQKTMDARSAFLVGNFKGLLNYFIVFMPIALVIVLFAPFPWQLESAIKIMAMPEMIIYYFLIPAIFFGARFIIKNRIKDGGIILAYIFAMVVIMALVEGNVGTLFRHRSLMLPFMFVLAAIGRERCSPIKKYDS